MIALRTGISATTLTAVGNATTSSITASGSGGRGTYTYLWSQSGTSCTITSSTSAATTFTGSGVAGTTTVFCNIRDTITGNSLDTSSCTITWTSIPITAMTFNVPASFIFNGTSTGTISVASVTPPAATYSPTSQVFGPAVGTYSMTTNGTGNYTGTYTSGSFSILNPITVSITPSIAAGGVSPQTISVLSISGGSGSYVSGTWSRVSFVGGTGGTVIANGNGTASATATRGGTTNTSSTFRVVITDSLGFTGTSNNCVISWNIA